MRGHNTEVGIGREGKLQKFYCNCKRSWLLRRPRALVRMRISCNKWLAADKVVVLLLLKLFSWAGELSSGRAARGSAQCLRGSSRPVCICACGRQRGEGEPTMRQKCSGW